MVKSFLIGYLDFHANVFSQHFLKNFVLQLWNDDFMKIQTHKYKYATSEKISPFCDIKAQFFFGEESK